MVGGRGVGDRPLARAGDAGAQRPGDQRLARRSSGSAGVLAWVGLADAAGPGVGEVGWHVLRVTGASAHGAAGGTGGGVLPERARGWGVGFASGCADSGAGAGAGDGERGVG